MNRRSVRGLTALIVAVIFFNSSVFACGPFSMEAVFVFTVHPSYPLERYAAGKLGVIQPGYARSYLYVAYRHLANVPFTANEQRALTEFWNSRLNNDWSLGEEEWVKAWLDARQKVVGISPSPKIEVYRNREKPNEYESYLNCTKDSFDTAVTTLNERIKRSGADSAAVRTWVEGQDQVFANCSEGQHIPEALSSRDDSAARADRNYQIAAANFYSTNFDAAQKDFEAIAADSSSPWSSTAPYLVARTLIRKASLGDETSRRDSLNHAETQLRAVLNDKRLTATHASAQRLIDLVRLRSRPFERLHELGRTLLNKTANDNLKQDLWDYTTLLDGILERDEQTVSQSKEALSNDELTDWISTLQGVSNSDTEHAVSRWEATHSVPWLVAAVSKIDGKSSKAAALITEAQKVRPASPAFASARYHAVRLMIESGKNTEARSALDQLLKTSHTEFDQSTLNLLSSERMMLADSLADFVRHAARTPAALSWNDDGREIPAEPADVSDENKSKIGKALFDLDAAKSLNTQMPLSVLKEAVIDQSLAKHLREDLVQAVWIRSILLGDFKTSDELAPTIRSLVPSLGSALDTVASTPETEAKKFSALYVWLKFPGIEPIVDAGVGRDKLLNEQDSYRDNWWCGAAFTPGPESATSDDKEVSSFTASSLDSPLFLTDAQRLAGVREWSTLKGLGAMPNYLSKQVIQWVTKHPTDPRAAEALHLAVNATRYGCTDGETGRWSKAAFDLLHRKYPDTSWAKKTKYWFKE